ncbi:hypothetical protein BsWGS_23047 [Bradybaena similaris]
MMTQRYFRERAERKCLNLLLLDTKDHGISPGDTCTAWGSIVDSWARSRTEEGDIQFLEFESYSFNVVFGPCLRDVFVGNVSYMKRVIEIIDSALVTCCKGFDAILLVFRFDTTIAQEDVSVLETLKAILGNKYLKHVIVLTIWPPFMENQCNFDDWCRKQEGPFQKLSKACKNTCVLVNTFLGGEETQIADSFRLAKGAFSLRNQHGRYTANYYKLNARNRQRLIITLKEPMLKEKCEQAVDILLAKIKEHYKQRKQLDEAIQKQAELTKEANSNSLLKELITIVLETGETPHNVGGETPHNVGGEAPHNVEGETPHNVKGKTPHNVESEASHNFEGEDGESLIRKKLKQLARRLASSEEGCVTELLKSAAADRMRKEMEQAKNIRDQMGRVLSTIKKYEGQCANNREEINEAIRKLKDEITTEDMGYGQLKHLMKIVLNLEKRLHSIDKIPKLLKRLGSTKEAAKTWGMISTGLLFLGGILSKTTPLRKLPIGIATAIDVIGCGTIAAVEVGTRMHLNIIDSTMKK